MTQQGVLPAADDDRLLVERCTSGDVRAFEQLVKLHQRRAHALALGILRNRADAQDVCQEAFLRAYRNLARANGAAKFSTWLHRIVVNLCIDQLRRSHRQTSEYDDRIDHSEAAPAGIAFDPQRTLANHELREQVKAGLARLSEAQRVVLVLRDMEGFSYREIADRVSRPIGTVMSRLFHARRHMQLALGELAARE